VPLGKVVQQLHRNGEKLHSLLINFQALMAEPMHMSSSKWVIKIRHRGNAYVYV
jgi:hypothetical protein